MSRVLLADTLDQRIRQFDGFVREEVSARIEANARQMQVDTVSLIPVRTGTARDAFASDEALLIDRRNGMVRATFGLRTGALRKQAFYAFWVETGTDALSKGGSRRSGKDKRGRQRFVRAKRYVPARKAQPFLRPAFMMLVARMRGERALAIVKAAARAGLSAIAR